MSDINIHPLTSVKDYSRVRNFGVQIKTPLLQNIICKETNQFKKKKNERYMKFFEREKVLFHDVIYEHFSLGIHIDIFRVSGRVT